MSDEDRRINPWKEKSKSKPQSKLQSCPDCGHQVSLKAATCPNCGRRIMFALAMFSAIFWAAVALSVFGAIVIGLLQIISM